MAQGENKVILIGYAGSPAEVKSTQGGTLIANFQLATSEKYTDRNNNKVEKTEWHNIAAFARTAEIVRDYVAKGSLLYLEGKLETSSWDDKESGKKMYKTQVVIRHINFLSPRPASESHGAAADQADYAEQAVDDSSIPF